MTRYGYLKMEITKHRKYLSKLIALLIFLFSFDNLKTQERDMRKAMGYY